MRTHRELARLIRKGMATPRVVENPRHYITRTGVVRNRYLVCALGAGAVGLKGNPKDVECELNEHCVLHGRPLRSALAKMLEIDSTLAREIDLAHQGGTSAAVIADMLEQNDFEFAGV